ncbi:MAG TPA: site-specific DNA-methyltransferase, partial [Caldisericia bacterium]|nr:site-specific DNA-methyltransferase [Caldisericia bacterium]
ETVPDYNCQDGCPVKELEEQSGILSTHSTGKHDLSEYTRHGNNGVHKYKNTKYKVCKTECGTAARFFYCAKPSPSEKHKGLDEFYWRREGNDFIRIDKNEYDKTDEKIRYTGNVHPTVKPIKLMREFVKLISPPKGGVILDPFLGSGTTGCGAVLEGCDFIGMDLNQTYIDMAQARIDYWSSQAKNNLFS